MFLESNSQLTVLVTGGSRGLGADLVDLYCNKGFKVVSGSRSGKCKNKRAESYILDLGKKDSIQQFFDNINKKYSKIDILINNGCIVKDSLIRNMEEEDFDALWDIGFLGSKNMIDRFEPIISTGGSIINVISLSAIYGRAGQCNYSTAKGALDSLARSYALKLGKKSICINSVNPGFMKTDMTFQKDGKYERIALKSSVLNCLSDSKKAAEFIAYIASLKTVSGQTFCFDSRLS